MLSAVKLYSLLYTQGLWVASRAKRLPEPMGPRAGRVGNGPVLRLLIFGDSSAVGVGVAHQDDALSGCLSRALAKDFTVDWTLLAKTGATSGSALQTLEGLTGSFDLAFIALGVNDAKNGVRTATWARNMETILNRLVTRHDCQMIGVSGLPPVDRFPLLPNPLRDTLAARARKFDQRLQQIAAKFPPCVFLRTHLNGLEGHMAEDGFHPGAKIYQRWANESVAVFHNAGLRERLASAASKEQHTRSA